MSKKTAAKQRDEAREKLMALASASTAPGQEQAQKALNETRPPAASSAVAPPQLTPDRQDSDISGSAVQDAGRAEKVSVSLHPQDQARLMKVENALRARGLIGRNAPTSFLLKIALASFSEETDLERVIAEVKSQDQRGKWMNK